MHNNYYLSPLAVALALGIASPSNAAEPMQLPTASFMQVKQKFAIGTQGISSAKDSLHLVSEHTDRNKITHVRMQQHYVGFPVHGGYAIMHSLNTARSLTTARANVAMNGVVYQGLQAEIGQPSASFVKNADAVLQEFKAKYPGKDLGDAKVIPMVFVDDTHKAHWAYKVSVFVRHQDKIPERPTAIIDAITRKPFVQWDDIKTHSVRLDNLKSHNESVNGRGFGGNNRTGEYTYGKDFPYLDLTRDPNSSLCFLENAGVKVIDMEHKYSSKTKAMKFNCPDNGSDIYPTGYMGDGYDEINGAYSPTNDALYAGYVINHMYSEWYNENPLNDYDGSGMQLVMRVHYGDGYENAYWDGEQMTFGDGDYMMYPLVSVGVGAHEISHGFTEQHSNLDYYGQSGGMNESFSDMAAQAADFYSSGTNTWKVGGEIMKEGSGYDALRYMDIPSKDGESIDNADEYYGGLDVHYSSGVYNRLFYTLATRPNWNTRLAFEVMVKANLDYWTPYSTFNDGGCGILSAAKDLGYSLDDVKISLKKVKINLSGCTMVANEND